MSEFNISVPGSDYNTIDFIGDTDTYSVWLDGGVSYDFDAIGYYNGDADTISPGIFDPTLSVTDPWGTQVASDDDGGALDQDAHIDFTAGSSGWYTLTVAGYGNETGDYTLETSYQPSFANDVVLVPV